MIPCYNEESSIPSIESEIRAVARDLSASGSVVEVVFVDDGSTDGTWPALTGLADRLRADVFIRLERHDTNRNLGAALRTGFAACRGSIIVTTDSDSTYKFSEIPALVSRLTSDVSIVTASPYHPSGGVAGVPPYRLVLSKGSSLIYRALVDPGIYTYTSLFRAYRAEVVRDVEFRSDGFLAVAEILVNAMFFGYRVAEYPTVLHARVAGTSKAKLLRTILAHLRFHGRIVLRRLHLGGAPRALPSGEALRVAGGPRR